MSQGYIGYQLSQAILNELRRRGIMRSTANVVTQTVVYPDDPAFQNPTKPVGAFLTEEEAKAKAAETGYTFKEDAGRGWRQVVASPKPRRIVESDAIQDPSTTATSLFARAAAACRCSSATIPTKAFLPLSTRTAPLP